MNHIYRVVWNACKGMWQVVSEFGSGRLRSSTSRARRRAARKALSAAALSAASAVAWAGPLPTGAQVVAGQASVTYAGSTMTVNQASQKAALDWSNFSIGQGHTVTFVQPSSVSVALNRVVGADPSLIQGALNANGHVFLVNPNGVLFSPTAQVNVGGLLASTLNLSTEDFLAGRYRLSGTSANAVENRGSITAVDGGSVALVAARVVNAGRVAADKGNVLLGAGSDVLVDFGGPVKLQVQKGALDALVDNGGAIRADGGTVLLTAKSAEQLTGSVINNTGIVQARTLATGERGQILLLGDMESGTLHAGGTLDAGAPGGGTGGAVETSAAHVDTAANLAVKASDWLVDPYDYTIGQTQANTIAAALNGGTNVTISTQSASSTAGSGSVAGTSGSGDIAVNAAIAKTSGGDASLTLRADRNITVGADITSTSGKLNLTLSAANAAGATTGGVTVLNSLKSNGGNILIGGGSGTVKGGIADALNFSTATPAVTIGNATPASAPSILSSGGDITINGRSLVGSNNGSYDSAKAGVWIRAGVTIKSGSGNLLVNGESDGGIKTFAIGFEGGPSTVTTLGNSAGGAMLLNAVNATPGNYTSTQLNAGAVGMMNNGSQEQVVFQGQSVAGWLIYINGAPQLSGYTRTPQLPCSAPYANCGSMVVPGSNNSYLYATYNAVDMSTNPLYVIQSGSGTRAYDGTTSTSGLSLSSLTDIAGFNPSSLSPTPVFTTPSKNVGTYTKLVGAQSNPTNYVSGGVSYALGYFNTGSYTITQKALTPSATSKVYDGNTTAAVSVSGVVAGDVVTATGSGTFGAKDVGSYNVSVSGITLGGADVANYSLSGNSASATASITPRTVTLSGSKTYDGAPDFSSVTIGNLVGSESLTATGLAANSANVAGASYFTAAILGNGSGNNAGLAANYQLPSLSAAGAGNAAAITPKALTITGLAAADKVYDGTTGVQITGGALSGLVGQQTLTLGGLTGAFTSKDVGTAKAVQLSTVSLVSGTGLASNYTFAQPSGLTANITQKALTVSGITAANKVYDGNTSATADASQAVLTGIVNGDAVTIGATGSFADKNAGTGKTVTLASTHGGADAGNYTYTDQASATAAITPKALSVSGMTAVTRTYDGTTSAQLTGGTLTGMIIGETVSVSGGSGSFVDQNAGTGKAVTVSGISLSNGTGLAANYTVTQPTGVTGTITPKALTITGLTATNKVYDGGTAAQLSGGTLSGLVNNETLSVTGGAGTFADKNVGTSKTVTVASVGLANGTGLAANYTVTQPASLAANITPKALSVSGITAADKVYDGNTGATVTTAGAVLSGLVNGDAVTVAATGAFGDKNAGTGKTVTLASTHGGADAGNYTFTDQASATAAIMPKALTVTGMTAATRAYDGTTAATPQGGALSGLVGNETLDITGGSGAFADANAGANKAVTVSGLGLANNTGLASNYSLAQPAGVVGTITPKALTITGLTAANKVYDGGTAAQLTGGTLSGLVNNETLSVTGGAGTFADKNVGTSKTVTVASVGLANGTGLAANYTVTQPASLAANITPKALSVSGITAADKVYDGNTGATVTTAGAVLSGLVNGDAVTVAATGAFGDKNAGTGKTVTLASTHGGADAGNYTFTDQASATAAIMPKALTVTGMTAATRAYDGTTAATPQGGTLSGLVGNETLDITGGSGAFADANAGTNKAVTVGGLGLANNTGLASNYSLAQPTGVTARSRRKPSPSPA